MMKLRNMVLTVAMIGSAAAVGTSAREAHAASATCTVDKVAYTANNGGTLQLSCGGNWYYAFGSYSGCIVQSADTKKAWQSLAQSAFLSGKPMYLEYTACGGGNALSYARLQN
jgi:hypothetical protein